MTDDEVPLGGVHMNTLDFGLTLPNRGVLFGVETMEDLLRMGEEADASGVFKSVWVGDSILAKRRPESVALLAALAARTRHVRLAVGCMASFPVRHPVRLTAHTDLKTNVERATRRITRHAAGWMTTLVTPAEFADRLGLLRASLRHEGRDADAFDNTLYYNVNINEDREAAAAESKKFLDLYYGFDITRPRLDIWVAYGPPEEVIGKVREFADAGAKEITFRITSFEQRRQYQRLVKEILPAFERVAVA